LAKQIANQKWISIINDIKEDKSMGMEITNNYIYNTIQDMKKSHAAESAQKEVEQAAQESANSGANKAHKSDVAVIYTNSLQNRKQGLADYVRELAKLAPSVDVKAGSTFSSARSGKTLTLSYSILNKMRNDPQTEKDMKDMIKGVEFITNFMDGIYKASGKTLVYQNSFIDQDGKYRCCSRVVDKRSLTMSSKLRQARKKNAQKLIDKSRQNAQKKRKELQKKSALKRTATRRVDIKL